MHRGQHVIQIGLEFPEEGSAEPPGFEIGLEVEARELGGES